MDGWLTTAQAAKAAGYTAERVRQLIREEKVEARKVGDRWFVREDSLLHYKAHRQVGRPARKRADGE